MLKSQPHRCEEQVAMPGGGVLPCNKPAERIIFWTKRKEGPYRMCAMCANHSVKNRGAEDIGPYEQATAERLMERKTALKDSFGKDLWGDERVRGELDTVEGVLKAMGAWRKSDEPEST